MHIYIFKRIKKRIEDKKVDDIINNLMENELRWREKREKAIDEGRYGEFMKVGDSDESRR